MSKTLQEIDEEFLEKFKEHQEIIKQACAYHDYKWPKELWTGVMFFNGERITIQEFNKWARNFK